MTTLQDFLNDVLAQGGSYKSGVGFDDYGMFSFVVVLPKAGTNGLEVRIDELKLSDKVTQKEILSWKRRLKLFQKGK